MVDLELFNFSEALNNDTHWLDSVFSANELPTPTLDMHLPLCQSINQASSANAPDSSDTSCDQTPTSDSSDPDCVTGAIEILQRLQTSHNWAVNQSTDDIDEYGMVARMQIASSAISRLSTILVCPCSQKTYVAILVASVCLTILDVYDSLFHYPGEPLAKGVISESNSTMDLDSEMSGVMVSESLDTGMDQPNRKVSSLRVLEELSKLANVVMQFSRKYKGDGRTQSAGTLSGLADSLKLRLRTVTSGAFESGYTELGGIGGRQQ